MTPAGQPMSLHEDAQVRAANKTASAFLGGRPLPSWAAKSPMRGLEAAPIVKGKIVQRRLAKEGHRRMPERGARLDDTRNLPVSAEKSDGSDRRPDVVSAEQVAAPQSTCTPRSTASCVVNETQRSSSPSPPEHETGRNESPASLPYAAPPNQPTQTISDPQIIADQAATSRDSSVNSTRPVPHLATNIPVHDTSGEPCQSRPAEHDVHESLSGDGDKATSRTLTEVPSSGPANIGVPDANIHGLAAAVFIPSPDESNDVSGAPSLVDRASAAGRDQVPQKAPCASTIASSSASAPSVSASPASVSLGSAPSASAATSLPRSTGTQPGASRENPGADEWRRWTAQVSARMRDVHPVLMENRDVYTMPRYNVLASAIQNRDVAFIATHQLFCLWTVEGSLASINLRLDKPVIDSAFTIIRDSIAPNNIRKEDLLWFAQFPYWSPLLWSQSPFVQGKALAWLSTFLNTLATRWPALLQVVGARQYPLLAEELRAILLVKSPFLEVTLFISSRTHLGVPNYLGHGIASRMLQLHRDDTQNFSQPDHSNRDAFKARLIAEYSSLYKQHLESQTQVSQRSSVQHHPGTPHPLQTQSPYYPAPENMMPFSHVARVGSSSASTSQSGRHTSVAQARLNSQHQTHTSHMAPGHRSSFPPGITYRQPGTQSQQPPYPPTLNPQAWHSIPAPIPVHSPVDHQHGQYNQGAPPSVIRSPMTPQAMTSTPTMGGFPGVVNCPQGSYAQGPPHPVAYAMPYGTVPSPRMSNQAYWSHRMPDGQMVARNQSHEIAYPGNRPVMSPLHQAQAMSAVYQANLNRQANASQWTNQAQQANPNQQYQAQQTQRHAQAGRQSLAGHPTRTPATVSGGSGALSQAIPPSPAPLTPGAPTSQSPVMMQHGTQPQGIRLLSLHPMRRNGPTATGGQAPIRTRPSSTLLPPAGYRIGLDRYPPSPYSTKSFAMSLHQVEAHSPRRAPRRLPGTEGEERQRDQERHYQSIKRLLVGPLKSQPVLVLNELEFDVTESDLQTSKLSTAELLPGVWRPVSEYFDGSLRWRLRICRFRNEKGRDSVAESDWVVQPTDWPPCLFVTVNDKAADIRRKTHYGQDQPLELTPFVRAGKNKVEINITSDMPGDGTWFFIGIELVEILRHGRIMEMVRKDGVMTVQATKLVVQNRLQPKHAAGATGGSDDDDDDIAIVDSSLSIDLADPFAASMFTIPARGASCAHLECFDLETWLNTRPSKPIRFHGGHCLCDACENERRLGPEPSLTDKWGCPLCGKDARPYSLRIDGFLTHVAAALKAAGKGETKTITVSADGTWQAKEQPVVERGTESPEPDSERAPKRMKSHHDTSGRPVPEVIELD